MTVTRLARRLGLDRNPLRRRTDKIAACVAVLLIAVFLIGAPLLSVAAAGWAGRSGASCRRAERSWHQVSVVRVQAAPVAAAFTWGTFAYSRVGALWATPGRRAQAAAIPVSAGLACRRTMPKSLSSSRPS